MSRYRGLLQAAGAVAMWVGAKGSDPYIMVAVDPARGAQLERTIPDFIDGVRVYYVEGIAAVS